MSHSEWLEAVEAGCAWAEMFGGNKLRLRITRGVLRLWVVGAVVRAFA